MTYAPKSHFAIGLSALSLVALSLGALGCAGGSSSGGTGGNSATGTGGNSSGTGGSGTGTGGGTGGSASGTGGSVGTGGSGTGGSVSTGGTPGTGGSVSTGGSVGTGGSGTGGATGGSGGSGGSAGKGGSTGTGGSAGKTGTGGAAGAGATTFFTDDFESDMAGKQPAGFNNLIAYNYNTTNPQGDISTPQATGTGAVADGTHTHNGSKLAVHIKGSLVLLERALPSGTNHLYVREFVYLLSPMGDLPTSSGDNHETLLGITADPTNANTQIRFGQIKGVIGTNQVPSDNIAPVMAQWNSGPVISAKTWHCIEVEFDGSATYNTLRAYSDGTLVHSISAGTDWQNGALAANWMSGMFTDVMFGWMSWSSISGEYWMDDVAMSTTGRIGCN
jgi:hypothetical protein